LLKDRLGEARAAGRTIFFSSHILADIHELCDRVGVLHAGRMIYLGTPKDFVATYNGPTLERAFLAALDQVDSKEAAMAAA
jgi:ABC-2 type transport system ATP-binding protein